MIVSKRLGFSQIYICKKPSLFVMSFLDEWQQFSVKYWNNLFST
ncbi:hypothetical protein SAMN04488688_106214 [Paenibacillus sp. cl141a]|nr:hypothetical protein SAMN04488688_106214 [Paenibacillus sp. cl141a]